jgi:hypothetical protein
MYAVAKLNKQHEQTWINLQKRLNELQFQYEKLFESNDVHKFIRNKVISVGSCEGYFLPSLIATAYLLACNHTRIDVTTHKQPLNIYTIFVGYPGTGKQFHIINTASLMLILTCLFYMTLFREVFCHPVRRTRAIRRYRNG